ncbi:hypothetical protein [Nostoc sp. UHCC 0870]|uniref:hypothetical protein n=1 Tax=Nostoc sp. UHCC 0870 TaxID=2914041 RepID=UPI001EDD164F|nr:hypothetical protein [Nostoc sp. UHCC 0870]UKP00519.1 hypothetical protein L6494_12785 [Nostoc sp. UHCC 0870]
MSDHPVAEPQPSPTSPSADAEKSEPQNVKPEASTGKNLAEELGDYFKHKSNEAQNFDDLLQRGLGVATVYIGGVHVVGNAKFEGDVSGRDIKVNTTVTANSSSAKGVAGQVAPVEIQKISSVYVQTDGYIQAQNILHEKHILIVRGDLHLGKWSTAICLLSSLHNEEILELDPIIEDLGLFECANQVGYVIDNFAPEGVIKLRRSLLNSLSHKFRQQNSHLVITLDSRIPISLEDVDGYIVHWENLPAITDLLTKHLQWYLPKEKLAIGETLMQTEEVRELLQQNKLLPNDVDKLAKLLVEVAEDQLKLNQALSRFSLLVDKQVLSWFETHPNLKQRVLMITLAVLSGTSDDTVLNASQNLQAIAKPPTQEDEQSNREEELNKKLWDEVKDVCAHLEKGLGNPTEYGSREVDLIVFDIPQFQPAILAYVWKVLYKWREPLLTWLHQLGSHNNFEVRVRAAAAVSELSKHNFDMVLKEVLRSWANSEHPRQQQLAALTFSLCIYDDKLAPQVLKLLKSWSNLGNNPRLAGTVIAAYSGVGILFPGNALRDLLAIAQSNNPSIFFAVAESIVNLFNAGQYAAVLQVLQDWTQEVDTSKTHQLGLVVFLELMQIKKAPNNSNYSKSLILLWLAKDTEEKKVYTQIITSLLQRALSLKATRNHALDRIHQWLDYVDYDSRFYSVLGRIIYNLAIDGSKNREPSEDGKRILSYLKRWAIADPTCSASKIISTISQHLNIEFRR